VGAIIKSIRQGCGAIAVLLSMLFLYFKCQMHHSHFLVVNIGGQKHRVSPEMRGPGLLQYIHNQIAQIHDPQQITCRSGSSSYHDVCSGKSSGYMFFNRRGTSPS